MIKHPLALLSFMFLVVAFARMLEKKFEWVKKISSLVLCTLLGILLANIGLIPKTSVVHEGIYDIAVPYTIVLVILVSRLRDLKKAGWPFLVCFSLAAVGSFLGAVIASFIFQGLLGPETWKLGGTFAGAFTGGGMNFAAVGRGLEMTPDLFAAAFVADNLSTVPYLLAQIGLFGILAPFYRKLVISPNPAASQAEEKAQEDPRRFWTSTTVTITDLALLTALPLGAIWISQVFGKLVPGFPDILFITTLALIMAQIPFVQRLRGAAVLSYFSLHLFFIVIGANSDISEVVKVGGSIFIYMILIILIHALVVYGIGWLLRFDLPTVIVASQAAIGGPGSAMAISMAMKWKTLIIPGIIVGIFGYALGNYLGFACAYILRGIL
jgi:uncharacterized membrane protein